MLGIPIALSIYLRGGARGGGGKGDVQGGGGPMGAAPPCWVIETHCKVRLSWVLLVIFKFTLALKLVE